MLWSIDSSQNRVSADQYHMTVFLGLCLRCHWRYIFFLKLFADKFLVFNWLQAQLQVDFFVIVISLFHKEIYLELSLQSVEN